MLNNVELYVNNTKDKALTLSKEVGDYLNSCGYTLITGININPDIVIGFGGDGTLIKWLASKNYITTARYIGINCGTLGFLQDFEVKNVKDFVDNIPNYCEQKLNFAELRITENDNKQHLFFAINEFKITTCSARALRTRVKIKNTLLEDFVGTGLIFATPTGSTAQNISSVGSIIHPGIEAIQMTPSEAQINNKAKNLPKSICIPKGIPITLTPKISESINILSDGNIIYTGLYSKISITYSNSYVTKLTPIKNNFIKKIRKKLI